MAGMPGVRLPGVLSPQLGACVGVYRQRHSSYISSAPPPPPPPSEAILAQGAILFVRVDLLCWQLLFGPSS